MNTSPFLSVNYPCDAAMQWSMEQLLQAGLRPVQTFDLHTARAGLNDCSCPNHGTVDCDCQLVVVLVYGNELEPATLILHGNDGRTWFSIGDVPGQKTNAKTVIAIRNSLEEKLPTLKSNFA